MYSSDQALQPTFSLPNEHILHPPSCENKLEPLEVTSSTYMSKEQHQQLHVELSQQSSDDGVINTISTLTSTLQQVNVPPAPPRLYSNQTMTYTEPLSITTLENSQSIDLSDTHSSTVTSQSHSYRYRKYSKPCGYNYQSAPPSWLCQPTIPGFFTS